MNTSIRSIIVLLLGGICFSCNQSGTKEKVPSKEELVQKYYQALNENDFNTIRSGIADSITQLSGPYKESWSRDSFTNWLEWDASFNPKYSVYNIQIIEADKVQLTLSKTCKRILFLNEEPTKYMEIFHFENDKIKTIEAGESIVFNDSLWIAKRDTLVAYVHRNHPELDGFMYDQTKKGAENYLKAITLYKAAQNKTK